MGAPRYAVFVTWVFLPHAPPELQGERCCASPRQARVAQPSRLCASTVIQPQRGATTGFGEENFGSKLISMVTGVALETLRNFHR